VPCRKRDANLALMPSFSLRELLKMAASVTRHEDRWDIFEQQR
jgi:hypothetical protein